jgi:hypothetical protein
MAGQTLNYGIRIRIFKILPMIDNFLCVRKGLSKIMFPSFLHYWLNKEFMDTNARGAYVLVSKYKGMQWGR